MIRLRKAMVGRSVTIVRTGPTRAWALNKRFYVVGRTTAKRADGALVEGVLLNRRKGLVEGALPALCWPHATFDGTSYVVWSEIAACRAANVEKEVGRNKTELERLIREGLSTLEKRIRKTTKRR